jgi:quercetin dioxygenase-like cupin family protein
MTDDEEEHVSEQLQISTLAELADFPLAPGVRGMPLFGQRLMFNVVEFEPGAVVPLHDHPHEQFGLVLEGELVFVREDGSERVLGPESVYAIPGGVSHEGRAGDRGARVLDVFTPVREDYRERFEAHRSGP